MIVREGVYRSYRTALVSRCESNDSRLTGHSSIMSPLGGQMPVSS